MQVTKEQALAVVYSTLKQVTQHLTQEAYCNRDLTKQMLDTRERLGSRHPATVSALWYLQGRMDVLDPLLELIRTSLTEGLNLGEQGGSDGDVPDVSSDDERAAAHPEPTERRDSEADLAGSAG